MVKDDIYIGQDAIARSPALTLKYPIEQGTVLDWDEFEIFCLNIMSSSLKLDNTDETPFVFSEPALAPAEHSEKLAEMSFEKFDIPEISIFY